jgi:hypothetical protein
MRRAVVLLLSALLLLIACSEESIDLSKCTYTTTYCKPFCDYWCDSWGCYPACWDRCWTECYQDPDLPGVAIRDGGPGEAAPPPVDAGVDAALEASVPADGGGGLCATCTTNGDCNAGSLCIRRGGSDAGTSGFCSPACPSGNECGEGFTCSLLGDTRRCLPTSGTCPAR